MKSLFFLLMLICTTACVKGVPTDQDVREAMLSTVLVDLTYTDQSAATISLAQALGIPIQPTGMTGTGVVVSVDYIKNESTVITAAHVIGLPEKGASRNKILEIITLDDHVCPAEILHTAISNDLAVLRVHCIAGIPATLALEYPPVGSHIVLSGAPRGYHPTNIFVVNDGRFLGIDHRGLIITTNPVNPGASGSGAFFDGKLVGIFVMMRDDIDHIALAQGLPAVRAAIVAAWDIQ